VGTALSDMGVNSYETVKATIKSGVGAFVTKHITEPITGEPATVNTAVVGAAHGAGIQGILKPIGFKALSAVNNVAVKAINFVAGQSSK